MSNTGMIILAAGNSSRLGRPKQLLPYQGKTLIQHVAGEALAAALHPVIVVTGAFAAEVGAVLQNEPVTLVYNPHWEEGMGSGIGAGLTKLLSMEPEVECVILAVCDQPDISAGILCQLMDKRMDTGKGIIASAYSGTVGTPVLFHRNYFEQLLALSGNEGAKKLLQQYKDDRTSVSFPGGVIDIDTEADYQACLS